MKCVKYAERVLKRMQNPGESRGGHAAVMQAYLKETKQPKGVLGASVVRPRRGRERLLRWTMSDESSQEDPRGTAWELWKSLCHHRKPPSLPNMPTLFRKPLHFSLRSVISLLGEDSPDGAVRGCKTDDLLD